MRGWLVRVSWRAKGRIPVKAAGWAEPVPGPVPARESAMATGLGMVPAALESVPGSGLAPALAPVSAPIEPTRCVTTPLRRTAPRRPIA